MWGWLLKDHRSPGFLHGLTLIFKTLLTNVLSTCLNRKNSFCSSISCWLEGEKKSITLTTHKNFLKEAESLKHILLLCHSYPKTNHLDTSGRTALTAFIREVPESHGHRIVWKNLRQEQRWAFILPQVLSLWTPVLKLICSHPTDQIPFSLEMIQAWRVPHNSRN